MTTPADKGRIKVSPGSMFKIERSIGSRWLFVGASGTGKTTTLIYALQHNWFGLEPQDEVILVSPTHRLQSLYSAYPFKSRHDGLSDVLLEEAFYRQSLRRVYNVPIHTILVLDDIITDKSLMNPNSPLATLFVRGRHAGITTIVLTQHYHSIPLICRDNSSVVQYETTSTQARRSLYDRVGLGSQKDFGAILDECFSKRRRPFIYDADRSRYYLGYDLELIESTIRADEVKEEAREASDSDSDSEAAVEAAPAKTAEAKDSALGEGDEKTQDNVDINKDMDQLVNAL